MEPNYVFLIGKIIAEVMLFSITTYAFVKSYSGQNYSFIRYNSAESVAEILTLKLSTKKTVTLPWVFKEIVLTECIRASVTVLTMVVITLLSNSLTGFILICLLYCFVAACISFFYNRFSGSLGREFLLSAASMINFAIVWSWFIPLHSIGMSDLDLSVIWLMLIASITLASELILINFIRALLWKSVLDVFEKKGAKTHVLILTIDTLSIVEYKVEIQYIEKCGCIDHTFLFLRRNIFKGSAVKTLTIILLKK